MNQKNRGANNESSVSNETELSLFAYYQVELKGIFVSLPVLS